MDLEYLDHLLKQITETWIDITYGSNEQNDIKNLVIEGFSYKQLELASITIAANKNVIFQNPKFLNYILEYANPEEKREFSEINNVFKFLPQSKIDFSDLPSKELMTKEEIYQELETRKQSIIKEVSIIIDNQEKLMNLLSAAIQQEDRINEIHQQAEERLKEIEDEKVKEITALKEEFEKQVEKKAQELKEVYESRERALSEEFSEQLVKTKQEYEVKITNAEKTIEEYEEKIKSLEIDRAEYIKAKERIEELIQQEKLIKEEHLALKIKISKYEEAEKNKLISEEEVSKVLLPDFDDEEDDENLIQEKGLLEDEFISNNDHNIMDNFNKGLTGENHTNEFNFDHD
jgi:chromosome segregation ATPase